MSPCAASGWLLAVSILGWLLALAFFLLLLRFIKEAHENLEGWRKERDDGSIRLRNLNAGWRQRILDIQEWDRKQNVK